LIIESGDPISVETIRPSQKMYKGFVIANSVLVLPILGGNLLIASRSNGEINGLAVFAFVAAVFLLLGVGIMLYFRNTRVDFGDGMISRTNMLGISKQWPLESVETVLDVPTLVAPKEVTVHTTFVLDTATRVVVRVSNRTWLPEQITRLVEATGVTPITLTGPTTAISIQNRYPRAVGWREAHPYQFATVAVLAFFTPFVIWFVVAVQ
jgi:hypothetical protein